ncbi:hypothetical protein ABFB09_05700 [Dehalogenimonas sp. THU2]|uniref:hypothetical protein n=1 Tax=Dehalogenimonas sp. THU2 TaxID=3151121 RepID=UPI0032183C58
MNHIRFLVLTRDHNVIDTISLAFHVGWPGIEVVASEDTRAISIYKKIRPAVVAIGLDLPNAQGFKLIRALRDLSDVPIISLSSQYVDADLVRAVWSDSDGDLLKPVGMFGIIAKVWSLLKRRSIGFDQELSSENSGPSIIQHSFPQRRVERIKDLIAAS